MSERLRGKPCDDEQVTRDELTRLFNKLCVDLGFCLAPDDYEALRGQDWDRPTDLANAVFAAEGMLEPYDLKLWRDMRDRIARYMANSAPDV